MVAQTRSKREVKRTGVDSERGDRNHQDNPPLVRTQDPSPPDDNAVGNNILNQLTQYMGYAGYEGSTL
jgi:hypothetical protein